MSDPTPVTISIMNTESGSVRIENPTLKLPATSQLYAVEVSARSAGERLSISPNTTTAATNAAPDERVEIQAAVRRDMLPPSTVISAVEPSGSSRQVQAAAFIREARTAC